MSLERRIGMLDIDHQHDVMGRAAGNPRWRVTEDMLHAPAFDWLRNLTKSSNRPGVLRSPFKETPGGCV